MICAVRSSTFLFTSPAACSWDAASCLVTSSRTSSRTFSKSVLQSSILLDISSCTLSVFSTTEAFASATLCSTDVQPVLKSSICLYIDVTVVVKCVFTVLASTPILVMRFSCASPRSCKVFSSRVTWRLDSFSTALIFWSSPWKLVTAS